MYFKKRYIVSLSFSVKCTKSGKIKYFVNKSSPSIIIKDINKGILGVYFNVVI